MQSVLYLLGSAVVLLVLMRLVPADSEPFHDDPAETEGRRFDVRLIGREAPRFETDAQTLLETLAGIATASWHVGIAQGSVDEGMITFETRSPVFGFRDYVTVKATDEAGGAKLSLHSRPRFNVYDWGANAKRLDRWLGELQQALGR